MSQPLFLEDLYVGRKFNSSTYSLSEEEIIHFASMYDPQAFHTDPDEAEKLFFKGLSASGWQTAAITMRLLVKSVPLGCGIIGLGVSVTWSKPVRPGDILHVETEIEDIKPSQSKPDRAVVTWQAKTINQHGEVVQMMQAKTMALTKSAAQGRG